MNRRRALAALLVLACSLAWAPVTEAADAVPPAPPPAPSPAPGMEASAPPAAKEPQKPAEKDPAKSIEALEELVMSQPGPFLATLAFRIGLGLGAVLLLVLAASRRSAVKQGLIPPPRPPPPPVVPLSLPLALLLVVATYLLVDATGPTLVRAVPEAYRLAPVLGIVRQTLPFVAAAILVLWLRRRARLAEGRPAPSTRVALRMGAWTFVVASAAAIAATFVGVFVLNRLGWGIEPQPLVLEAVRGPAWQTWLIAAYGVTVAPFAEEALFRGLLHPAARPFLGARGATVVVAVLFAAVHESPTVFLPLLVLALFLGWLLEKTDSLLATFTVHALFNATSLVPLLLLRHA